MKWKTQRAKRVAIDKAKIRKAAGRMGPFSEGFRAARLSSGDDTIACPYKPSSQAAKDWHNGWAFQMEKP